VNFKGIPSMKLKVSGISASQLSYEIFCMSFLKSNYLIPDAAGDETLVLVLGLNRFKNAYSIILY
jgi:hypothetical protein